MEEKTQKLRLEGLLGCIPQPKPEDTIVFLKEKEKLDEDLLKTIMSESVRIGGPELLQKDGVTARIDGKAYMCSAPIENVYSTNHSELKKKGVDIGKLRSLSLAKAALEAKAVIYVLGKDANGDGYAYKITPLGVGKTDSTYISILDAIVRRQADKRPEGYA